MCRTIVSYFTQFVILLTFFSHTVAPMIVITNSMIYASNGTVATLECKVSVSLFVLYFKLDWDKIHFGMKSLFRCRHTFFVFLYLQGQIKLKRVIC